MKHLTEFRDSNAQFESLGTQPKSRDKFGDSTLSFTPAATPQPSPLLALSSLPPGPCGTSRGCGSSRSARRRARVPAGLATLTEGGRKLGHRRALPRSWRERGSQGAGGPCRARGGLMAGSRAPTAVWRQPRPPPSPLLQSAGQGSSGGRRGVPPAMARRRREATTDSPPTDRIRGVVA